MSAERFEIVDTNPNDTTGGGGCLCGEVKPEDASGPYAVFYGPEMASNISPNAVVCAGCLRSAAKALDGEVIAGGESSPEIEAVEGEDYHEVTLDDEVESPVDESGVPEV